MTATTDLRAALREAAAMLESYSEIGFYSDAAKARAKVAEFRALADAPPTVAELLPLDPDRQQRGIRVTATTDLRAALREACKKLHGLTPHASADENAEINAWADLADAPPTVAELLPLVDATHRLEWTDADDDERIAQLEGTVIKSYFRSPGKGADAWSPIGLLVTDTTRPAKLVEVTP